MKEIYILSDYNDVFESKHFAIPLASGMDKVLLEKYFKELDYQTKFMTFSQIDFRSMNLKNKYVLYTSSEDIGYFYKDYIEDIILGLHLHGARVIPDYKYLRANNNKVFMEILRDISKKEELNTIRTHHFGTLDDLQQNYKEDGEKKVFKLAQGARSRGVFLGKSKKDLISIVKKNNRTRDLYYEFKEFYRTIKYKGYKANSKYRKKFIVQDFVENLDNDWKVIIFKDKYYTLFRKNRPNDFRASGSGIFSFDEELPEGLLDFSKVVYDFFNVPILSLDIGYNGKEFFVLEFQMVYFGKTTCEEAGFHFELDSNHKWKKVKDKINIEKEYAKSIDYHIKKNYHD